MIAAALCLFAGILGIVAVGAVILVASSFFRELEPGVREWIEDDSPEPTKLGHMFPNMFGSANGAD